jgi:hypothetical protein
LVVDHDLPAQDLDRVLLADFGLPRRAADGQVEAPTRSAPEIIDGSNRLRPHRQLRRHQHPIPQ